MRSERGAEPKFCAGTHGKVFARARSARLQSLLAHLSSHLSADLLSTLDFDESGDYLATGDRGGRIVVFERSAVEKVRRRRRRRSPTPTAFGAADGDRAAPHHTHATSPFSRHRAARRTGPARRARAARRPPAARTRRRSSAS